MSTTWSIVQLDYAVSLNGETDVVNNSHWQCVDVDADGNQRIAILTENNAKLKKEIKNG